jgi:trans-2,3-dihydro-3-hydroxyanthranilate isomerase
MAEYRFLIADVFTDTPFCGNQLAVLPDARGLDGETMQRITREFNFAETIFVFQPENPKHTRRVRIFTPGRELPFAGHPTVGCAVTLAAIGEFGLNNGQARIVLEEGVGPISISIRAEPNRPLYAMFTTAKLPEHIPGAPPIEGLANALSLDANDLLVGEFGPQIFSCGLPFLFVPLRNLDAVRRCRPNLGAWDDVFAGLPTNEVFAFTMQGERDESAVHARMFAPALGVTEDAATGSACAALTGYLGARDARRDGTLRWRVEQGFEMGRPSIIDIETDKRDVSIIATRVGGHAVLVAEGTLHVPHA